MNRRAEPFSRRQFLRAALIGTGVALLGASVLDPILRRPPKLLWAEEFDKPLDLHSATNPSGRWRAADVWQDTGQGYVDFGGGAGSCWMANPEQVISGMQYNPFGVRDSKLRISVRRTPDSIVNQVAGCHWLGGILISNTARADMTFDYGYYEVRARYPIAGRGMFPAIWLYSAHGKNPSDLQHAEIDLFEIFGKSTGRPWSSSIHTGDDQIAGARKPVLQIDTNTAHWHTYGLNWTPTSVSFYQDRRLLKTITGAPVHKIAGSKMSIRLTYSMDATWFEPGARSDETTPELLYGEFDYVRKYDRPFS